MNLTAPKIPKPNQQYKGHMAMLVAYLIFGLNLPVSKWVLSSGELTTFDLSLLRFIGGAALFWAVSLAQPREKVALKDIGLLLLASLLGIQGNQVAFMAGLALTTPVTASIISTIGPIITMLLAALFLREPITWKKGVGVAIGASGALLLILRGNIGHGLGGDMRGNLLCIASSLCFSLYLTLFKKLIMRYSPVTLMKWMFLFAAVCCTPFGYKGLMALDPASLSWPVITGVIFVVFMATFISYMLLPFGQKVLRPTLVSMYNYVQPLVASLVAVAMGIDTFGWVKAVAAALIFLGVWVVNKSKSRAQVDIARAQADLARASRDSAAL